jgi:hypothetical protein
MSRSDLRRRLRDEGGKTAVSETIGDFWPPRGKEERNAGRTDESAVDSNLTQVYKVRSTDIQAVLAAGPVT